MMNIKDTYTHALFSNSSYVDWRPQAFGSEANLQFAIVDANNAEKVPGVFTGDVARTLGEKVFRLTSEGGDGWHVSYYTPNDEVGFSASLFENETGNKILAIRGTEGGGNAPEVFDDLLAEDLTFIGFFDFALRQTISMINYIQRLTAPENVDVVQLRSLRVRSFTISQGQVFHVATWRFTIRRMVDLWSPKCSPIWRYE